MDNLYFPVQKFPPNKTVIFTFQTLYPHTAIDNTKTIAERTKVKRLHFQELQTRIVLISVLFILKQL